MRDQFKVEVGHTEIVKTYTGPICDVCGLGKDSIAIDAKTTTFRMKICRDCIQAINQAFVKHEKDIEDARRRKEWEQYGWREDRSNSPG